MRSGLMTILGVLFLLCCTAGCGTLNVGWGGKRRGPDVMFTASELGWYAGEVATMTVDWYTTGTAPYTIAIDMGGGTTEDVPAGTAATSPFVMDFTLVEGSYFSYKVTVTDANGFSGYASNYYYVREVPNEAPVISVTVSDNVITVTVADAEGDDVTVEVRKIKDMSVDTNHVVVAGGNGDAVFTFTADTPYFGASGETTISAYDDDSYRDPVEETAVVVIEPVRYDVPAGALAAIPLQTTAAVGDTVMVLVVAGNFPADAAFAFLNGVAVTTPDGGDYVYETMNIGAPGGGRKATDGIWEGLSPAAKTYLLPEDYMMEAMDVVDDTTHDYMGFNITPLEAGGQITVGGELFNFGMRFDHVGEYRLGFLEFQEVRRTYYSNEAAAEFNWDDISNDYAGIPNSIIVD